MTLKDLINSLIKLALYDESISNSQVFIESCDYISPLGAAIFKRSQEDENDVCIHFVDRRCIEAGLTQGLNPKEIKDLSELTEAILKKETIH